MTSELTHRGIKVNHHAKYLNGHFVKTLTVWTERYTHAIHYLDTKVTGNNSN